jgi:hypothetical protein
MIAKMRGPFSVKNHSFAVCARPLPVLQSAPESSRALLISPLLEQPGFSLGPIHPSDSEEGFYELRVDGVLGSSPKYMTGYESSRPARGGRFADRVNVGWGVGTDEHG